MILVVAGAGASYDSILTRPVNPTRPDPHRLPLANDLFAPSPMYEEIQRLVPQVLQVATQLVARPPEQSVEDVLAGFSTDANHNPRRHAQLAAVRFYLQALIARLEDSWYRNAPVSTNMMALLDQIENARRGRAHPLLVTFNYDRLIEHALENAGQRFNELPHYVGSDRASVIKLHGSVDWARPVGRFNAYEYPSQVWELAVALADRAAELPAPGPIERFHAVPPSLMGDRLAIPALSIPVREKDRFECPPEHVAFLEAALPNVHAVVTIGWRAQEQHFLRLLASRLTNHVQVLCVGGSKEDAAATISALQPHVARGHFEAFGAGFSEFIRHGRMARLLRIGWG